MGETQESELPLRNRQSKIRRAVRRIKVVGLRRGVRFNRFARKYRDGLELGLLFILGIATVGFAFQANNFAGATRDATEQQAQMQKFNSLPNFVIKEQYLSPVGDRTPMTIVIENEGGWARYAEAQVFTKVTFYAATSQNVKVFVGSYWVDNYLLIDGLDLGENHEPVRWRISSNGDGYHLGELEDKFENFFEDILQYLKVQYGLENLEISIDVYITFSYGDFQGKQQSEHLQIARDYEAGKKYLALLPEESWEAIKRRQSETLIQYPLSVSRDSQRWNSEIAAWGDAIYENYVNRVGASKHFYTDKFQNNDESEAYSLHEDITF